jgi:hypothetical protein
MKHVSDRRPWCPAEGGIIKASESAKIHPGLAVGGYVFILFWTLPSGGKVVKEGANEYEFFTNLPIV